MLLLYAAFALLSATLVHAAPTTPEKRQGTLSSLAQVITSCTVNNTAALTFDDGPYLYIKNISDQLANAGARGTFFFNGNNWGCIYSPDNIAGVQYAYAHGHQIASHTWSHPHLNNLTLTQVQNEFSLIDQALERIVGLTPAFMRPPYGEYNNQVLQVAASRGEKVIVWDFDSGDSTGSTAAQSNKAYDQLVSRHPSSILTLNHEVYETTVNVVLPHAISVLQAKGYQLVTVSQCLDMPPYQAVALPQNGTWTC